MNNELNTSLEIVVDNLISLRKEGTYWDFKREWHKNKVDLIHDIICLANNQAGEKLI